MTQAERIKQLEQELAEAKRDKDRALDLADALKDIVKDQQKTAKEYVPYPVPYPVDRWRKPYQPYWYYQTPYQTWCSSTTGSNQVSGGMTLNYNDGHSLTMGESVLVSTTI